MRIVKVLSEWGTNSTLTTLILLLIFFLFELGSNSNLITLNFYSHFDFI